MKAEMGFNKPIDRNKKNLMKCDSKVHVTVKDDFYIRTVEFD